MRYYLLVIGVLVASTGNAIEIFFENITYQAELVGRKYFVYQPSVPVIARDVSGLSKTDCDLLSEQIAKKEIQYYICDEMPDSPACRLLKKDAIFKSKEENFQTPINLYPTNRTWILEAKNQAHNEAALKSHVATMLGVRANDVIIELSTKIIVPEFPVLVKSESSLLGRVSKILPLSPGFLEPLRMVNGNLVANNRFLACDLENGKLKIVSKSTLNLSYTDAVSEDDLASIWVLYNDLKAITSTADFKKLPRLIQAALIGRAIGVSMDQNGLNESFGLEKVFEDLFY